MHSIAALAFAFAVGLTVAGLAGSVLEIAHARRLTLAPPFLCRERLLSSLGTSAVAGPFMLANDALEARGGGRIGGAALLTCLLLACVWLLACGVLVTELAFGLAAVLHAGM